MSQPFPDDLRRLADDLERQAQTCETAQAIELAAYAAAAKAAVIVTRAACSRRLGPDKCNLTDVLRFIAERGRDPDPLQTWHTIVLPNLQKVRSEDFRAYNAEFTFLRFGHETDEARRIRHEANDKRIPMDWSRYRAAMEAVPGFGPIGDYTPELQRDHARVKAWLYADGMRAAANLIDGATPSEPPSPPPPPDGPFGGRYLRVGNDVFDVPPGVVYKLLDHMYGRDGARYDDLMGTGKPVWEDMVQNQTVRSKVSAVNKVLKKTPIKWRLSAEGRSRHISKKTPGPKARKRRRPAK